MFIVGIQEGQSVQIADRVITVQSVIRPGLVQIMVHGETEPTLLSWDRKLTLFPGVGVTVDRAVSYSKRIKLFFDAPRSIRIRELPYVKPVRSDS